MASILSNVFTYKNLAHAISGAAGSIVGLTVFFPLDTARTRLQVDDGLKTQRSHVVLAHIINQEGIVGLYRGWFPVVTSLCCSNFVYFYTYNSLKEGTGDVGASAHPLKDLSLAFLAGVVNVLVTTPLWVVNTRLKLQGVKLKSEETRGDREKQRYTGIIDCLYQIIRREGVRSLWSGTLPSLVLVTNPAIQFMVYELLKRNLQHIVHATELSGLTYFVLGALAKMVSTLLTYPMQMMQTRVRAGYQKREYHSKNVIDALKSIIQVHGWYGLYKGLEAKLLQTILMAALMFMTYEEIVASIFKLMGEDAPANRT